MPSRPKKVVYVVIDGMHRDAFEQVTASGKAPALRFIRERSSYVRDAVAVFPTITPVATASLVTGAPPSAHGIPGMCWYDRAAQRFVNYGQSPRAAVVEGLSQVVEDVLHNLNEEHLSPGVDTVHETLDRLGFRTASINYMVFRGPHTHEVKPNALGRALFRKHLPKTISGPLEHYFADVVGGAAAEGCKKMLSRRGGPIKRMAATDSWAACVARELLESDAADMILFYLHENDHQSHKDGPGAQVDSLAEADRHVAYVLDAFGSWERTAEEVGFVVTSDHSQSPIADDSDHVFALEDVLGDFTQVAAGKGGEPFGERDIACAGNGRVGFVYLNEDRRNALLGPVTRALGDAPGIDQVM